MPTLPTKPSYEWIEKGDQEHRRLAFLVSQGNYKLCTMHANITNIKTKEQQHDMVMPKLLAASQIRTWP